MSEKATNIEYANRVSQVKRLFLQCKTRPEILQFIAKSWGVSERQAGYYMARARREIQAEFSRRDKISMTWHLKARQNIINQAMDNNEPRVALAAMRDIAELQGLYVEKHEVTGKDGGAIEIRWPDDSNPAT